MKITVDGVARNAPDFLIVGAAKAGTTSLYYYLKQHKDVYLSPIKEPHYFVYARTPSAALRSSVGQDVSTFVTELEPYLGLFARATPTQVLGEASTTTLYKYREAVANIRALYGENARKLKILAILRNPVERAWSSYANLVRHGIEPCALEQAIEPEVVKRRMDGGWSHLFDYIGLGLYSEQITYYREHFDNVLIVTLDDLEEQPKSTMANVLRFLGVDASVTLDTSTRFNTSGSPRNFVAATLAHIVYKPFPLKGILKRVLPYRVRYDIATAASHVLFKREEMSTQLRKLLYELYEGEIGRLEVLLQRDLARWKCVD